MADYWKSIDKKYCDVCKCWITDNKATIQTHESGKRHQENAKQRLWDIQKKTKSADKEERNVAKMLKKIEAAASASIALDKELNPDMSLKIETYLDYCKEKEIEEGGVAKNDSAKEGKKPEVKILHREQKVKNEAPEPPPKPYVSRFGGWTQVTTSNPLANELELPSSSYSTSKGKSTSKPTVSLSEEPFSYVPKFKEKKKRYNFEEKTVSSLDSSKPSPFGIKTESDSSVPEISFKKRKFPSKSNARQRLDD